MTAGGLDGLAESYSYDQLGNRTVSHISTTHLVNENNQLLSDEQFTYTYDLNGNLESKTETATSASPICATPSTSISFPSCGRCRPRFSGYGTFSALAPLL